MKEDIDIEGKKYISARRVSEKSGYNCDYLGQLCRGNKLDCRLISRAWFVEEQSLIKHLKNGRKKTSPLLTEEENQNKTEKNIFFSEKEKEALGILKSDLIKRKTLTNKIFSKRLLVNYFFAVFISISISLIVIDLNNLFLKDSGFFARREVKELVSDIHTELSDRSEAFISKFIGGLKHKIALWFGKDQEGKLTADSRFEAEDSFIDRERKGLVSIPWTEFQQEASLEVVKEYVKESFSDEVLVLPDESKTSGVIKPVFRTESNEEYLYVMVPVR